MSPLPQQLKGKPQFPLLLSWPSSVSPPAHANRNLSCLLTLVRRLLFRVASTSALGNVFVFVLTFALSHHKSSGPDFNSTLCSGERSLSSRPLFCGRGSLYLASAREEEEGEGGREGLLFSFAFQFGALYSVLGLFFSRFLLDVSPLCPSSGVSLRAAGGCAQVPHLQRKPQRRALPSIHGWQHPKNEPLLQCLLLCPAQQQPSRAPGQSVSH